MVSFALTLATPDGAKIKTLRFYQELSWYRSNLETAWWIVSSKLNTCWIWQKQMKLFNGFRIFWILTVPKDKQSQKPVLFKIQWSNIGTNIIIILVNTLIYESNIWNCIFRWFCGFLNVFCISKSLPFKIFWLFLLLL